MNKSPLFVPDVTKSTLVSWEKPVKNEQTFLVIGLNRGIFHGGSQNSLCFFVIIDIFRNNPALSLRRVARFLCLYASSESGNINVLKKLSERRTVVHLKKRGG